MRCEENAWQSFFLHELNAVWEHENRRDASSLPSMVNLIDPTGTMARVTWHADLLRMRRDKNVHSKTNM